MQPERTAGAPDVLVVSIGTTGGWRAAAGELAGSLERAGARVAMIITGPVGDVRTFALTDLVQAMSARRAASQALAQHRPGVIVYCSITAALLWPSPGAIWLDATAAENRPGRHGVWQRGVERRRLSAAPLVMAMGARSLKPLGRLGAGLDAVVLPSPVEPSAPAPDSPGGVGDLRPVGGDQPPGRDVAAITYAGDPEKKRLEVVLSAWERARGQDELLVVAGTAPLRPRPGVRFAGRLPPSEYRALLRRARTFVAAPRREDYGIAPLEALADGCVLVSTPAPGPYPALGLARSLDARLVSEDLAEAIRLALDDPAPGYARKAAELLAPFRRAAVDRTIAERVLPRLLPGWRR